MGGSCLVSNTQAECAEAALAGRAQLLAPPHMQRLLPKALQIARVYSVVEKPEAALAIATFLAWVTTWASNSLLAYLT